MMLSEETSAVRPQKQTRFNGAKLVWMLKGRSAHRDRRSHHCINAIDDDFFTVAGDASSQRH
ncbi:D-Ala-D-Ala transporter [Escherichia coli]